MGSRRGERLGDGVLHELRRYRLVAEPAHRAAQQLGLLTTQLQGLGGAQPKQIVGAGPHELPRRGIGIRHDAGGQPAHDGHRYRGQLALDQIGRRGDLVGNRHLGDQQLVAVPIDRAGVAVQHGQAGRADCGVGLAVAPRAAHGVGDHDADGDAEFVAQPGAQGRSAAVGVYRQQCQFVGTDVGAVHSGRGLNHAQPVLGDQRATFAGKDANGLIVDKLAAQHVSRLGIFWCGHQAAFAFGQHLAGDDQHIAVAQPGCGRSERGAQVVAGAELGQAGDRQDLNR